MGGRRKPAVHSSARTDNPGARELGLKDVELLSISKSGELAVRLNTAYFGGYARTGTLARVPLSGGTPREVLDNAQDADWAANSESIAVVRYVPENNHWRLEYPIGKVLFDSINWISHPKISPDGKSSSASRLCFLQQTRPFVRPFPPVAAVAAPCGSGRTEARSGLRMMVG